MVVVRALRPVHRTVRRGVGLINFSVDEIVNPKLKAATRSQIKKWKLEEKAGKAKSDAAFPAGNVAHVAAKESVAS